METCRIAFTGHRNKICDPSQLEELNGLYPNAVWVHGGAEGFDTQVSEFARAHGIKEEVILPDYKRYPGHVAPLRRNDHGRTNHGGHGTCGIPGQGCSAKEGSACPEASQTSREESPQEGSQETGQEDRQEGCKESQEDGTKARKEDREVAKEEIGALRSLHPRLASGAFSSPWVRLPGAQNRSISRNGGRAYLWELTSSSSTWAE